MGGKRDGAEFIARNLQLILREPDGELYYLRYDAGRMRYVAGSLVAATEGGIPTRREIDAERRKWDRRGPIE